MSRTVIEVHALRKTYADARGIEVHALRGVDLVVEAGEFVAVMGPSGSGKSSLLHIVGALDTATSGDVTVGGTDLVRCGERERTTFRREQVGFVFQAFHLVPSMSVAENVALSAVVADHPPSTWRGRSQELLDAIGLGDLAARYPSDLSGGEQQRVAVARAIFGRPAVLLADEPTGQLDAANGDAVLKLMGASVTAGPGSCGVLATHDPRAASHAHRVVAMRDGVVVDTLNLTRPGAPAGGDDHAADRIRSWVASAQA